MKRIFLSIFFLFFSLFSIFSHSMMLYDHEMRFSKFGFYPKKLISLMRCYPDVEYKAHFDLSVWDWEIYLTANIFENRPDQKYNAKKHATLYWADGRMLPRSELSNKSKYWSLQYKYNDSTPDPKNFTREDIERIKEFGSSENRKNQAGSPMFFFDFLYSARSRIIIEDHVVKTSFLGKKTKVHERIVPALKNVEKTILKAAATDSELKAIVESFGSADAYHWREIRDTSRKSFHSYGIALDILPKKLKGKAIYWSWEKDRRGEKWMLTPLEERWTPGKKIIKIFENNGFIWGGNWIIFDCMHFEYHPELVNKF
ncbi:MAG: M15 family metallopeptidase [Treponema sp.]|nr:M15 family metallopeptidase [Candidatus Treponema equifaecale]